MTLTPVESHEGLLLKREDRHALPSGVNGSKLRACQHLIGLGKAAGKTRVISAASVLSPQSAMAATVARSLDMACTVIIGGSKPATAARHRSIRIAMDQGADIRHVPVGYNPYLQARAREAAAADPAAYWLQYGITTPPAATTAELRAFHEVGAGQVDNLPATVRTLVLPFGSGNTATGVLYGLARNAPPALERIILMGIGPDRQNWLTGRLAALDIKPPVPTEHVALHPEFATYGDKMPATIGPVPMHPTYEGKIVRWAEQNRPDWWERRDNTTCLWVVGGPLGA